MQWFMHLSDHPEKGPLLLTMALVGLLAYLMINLALNANPQKRRKLR
jgi:hypothetical protein